MKEAEFDDLLYTEYLRIYTGRIATTSAEQNHAAQRVCLSNSVDSLTFNVGPIKGWQLHLYIR